jgi:hypothetical protein
MISCGRGDVAEAQYWSGAISMHANMRIIEVIDALLAGFASYAALLRRAGISGPWDRTATRGSLALA